MGGIRMGTLENVNDWEECMDNTGQVYYYNKKRRSSQWIRPRFRQTNAHPRRGVGFGEATDKTSKLDEPKQRKSDWHQESDEHNRIYWWNSTTGESRWTQPNFMTADEELTAALEADQ